MEKWAEYLISEVKYVETTTTKHISQVKVHVDTGDKVADSKIWSRQDVINAIDLKSTFMTITKAPDGNWKKGAEVIKILVNNVHYIKTEPDNTTKDNLGSLPEF